MIFKWLLWLHRKGVSRSKLKDSFFHKIFGNAIFAKDLWKFNKHSVAWGWVVGCMAASNPFLGLQILLGLPFALIFRANLFVMIALVFTTNPLTIGPFLVFCYAVGSMLTGEKIPLSEEAMKNIGLADILKQGFSSMMLGCLVVGAISALLGWVLIQIFWKEKNATSSQSPENPLP